ncbi:DNA polymerase III subunit alpha [Buchnera aphidicola (Ceratovacuna keduensis)]|uniref:DNA polymerase III subunit alpha n=1 Tax=Buchnera aphidicola TaxID=9 RepID=UPI0031B82F0F
MKNFKFVHLNLRSYYSIIDGFNKPKSLLKKAFDNNMTCLGINDFGNMFGILKFYNIAHYYGIKPILGISLKVKFLKKYIKIILLAKNYFGYNNLIIISSKLQNNNLYKKKNLNYVDSNFLKNNAEGLLLIINFDFFYNFNNFSEEKNIYILRKYLNFCKKYFYDSFYLEIIRINMFNEEFLIQKILETSYIYNVPVLATNKVLFINKNDFYIHKIRVCISKGISISSIDKNYIYTKNQYLKSENDMLNLFSDIPDSIKNSVEISKRCNVILSYKKYFLPKFLKNDISSEKFLIKKAYSGIKKRLKTIYFKKKIKKNILKKYYERLSYELKIINKMGFPGYFLIVMEFVLWAKKKNIPVGPGRGSGAGSLVAYALFITEINPIDFNLLFERFLNPERLSMPDFDIDFCMDRRDEVIFHISKIYGKDYISQIITFGTMSAKSVIRDVGRVLGYPYGFINYISKLVPTNFRITIDKAFKNQKDLKKLYEKDVDIKNIVNISRKLEGVVKNVGKHSGGIIISPNKIINCVPLYFDKDCKNSITQFDKNDLEKIGLIKFDLLGLRTLTLIQNALLMIKKYNFNKFIKIDMNRIDLNDKKVFKLFKNANTIAIFQLESKGMQSLIRKMNPNSFEDIIALVALFRPGPLQSGMVKNFIDRKNGIEKIYYPDKNWQDISLKPILKSTYGIILYQEQVMQIAQLLSGYSLGNADIFRRSISKKDPKEMKKQRIFFNNGAIKKGIDKNFSSKIFDLLEKFAGYGFNKSHSTAYAMITYQTMWLKTYYPSEFMASVMNVEIDKINRLVILIDECRRIKINIIPPNINFSSYNFDVYKNDIIYALGAIKGIGISSIKVILKERKKNGVFSNILDLCIRTSCKKITFSVLKKLVFSGAFDCFNLDRYVLKESLKDIMKLSIQYLKNKDFVNNNLFGNVYEDYNNIIKFKKKNCLNFTLEEKIKKEYSSIGLYLNFHPVTKYLKEIKKYKKIIRIKKLYKKYFLNKVVLIFGIISSIRKIISKNNNKIISIILDDCFYKIEVIFFDSFKKKVSSFIKKQKFIFIKGKVVFDKFLNKIRIIAIKYNNLEELRNKYLEKIIIFIDVNVIKKKIKKNIFSIIKKYNYGNLCIKIYENNLNNIKKYFLVKKYFVFPKNELFNKLELFLGKNLFKILKK